ncbi:MAG TPA: MFS transporter [Thermomicrobiales bacterium]
MDKVELAGTSEEGVARQRQTSRGWRVPTPEVLAVPAYRRLWVAGLFYYHANMAEIVIAGWAVLELTGSALSVGLVGFCRMLPMLVLGAVLGSLADRFRGHLLLSVVQLVGLLTAIAMTILFTLGGIQLWQIYLLTGIFGCAWTCDFAARRALIAQIQEPARIANAMALESVSMLASKIGATALGGWLLAIDGPRLAYGWLALVYGAGFLATLRMRGDSAALGSNPPAAVSLLRLVISVCKTATGVPIVRALLLITVVMNLCVFCYQQIIAVIAGQILLVDSTRMGLLAGADGIGAIVAAAILMTRSGPLPRGRVFLGGACGACILVVLLGASHFYAISLLVQIVIGACATCFGAMQSTIIAGAIAPEMRARAMGILAMAIGVTPFGILLTGALSTAIGPSLTLISLGIAALLLNAAIIAQNRTLLQPEGA